MYPRAIWFMSLGILALLPENISTKISVEGHIELTHDGVLTNPGVALSGKSNEAQHLGCDLNSD